MEIIKDFYFDFKLRHHEDHTMPRITCDGCDEVIEPHSWYYIGNDGYAADLLFHKFCGELPREITHPLHPHQHLLKLEFRSSEDRSCHFCHRSSSSNGEITLTTPCNGCCKPISAPLYSCMDCKFYIHKSCALLPSSISQHHAHSEQGECRLVLLRVPWHETRVSPCYDCEQYCNGFSYQCEEESCNYQIDVECAFLPKTIVHKSHPFHPLHLVNMELDEFSMQESRYYKCCLTNRNSYAYKCDTCIFLIHAKCAMYPAKAHHRFDCDSPFNLCYNPSEIEPNDYHYCDICEKILDPKLWFYFSSKSGGQIMHPECILLRHRAVVHPKFKSISSILEVDLHPHLLHLYPTSGIDSCSHCVMLMEDHNNNTTYSQQPCYFYFAYQCVEFDCEYKIDVGCADKFILQAEEHSQETVDPGINTEIVVTIS